MTPTPIIPKADEVQRYELVSHGQYSMRYESLDEDPNGDWVKYDDHLRVVEELRALLSVTRAPSPAVGGEVTWEEAEQVAQQFCNTAIGVRSWSKFCHVEQLDIIVEMRAALEAFVRGRGR